MYRTHDCGALRLDNVNETITIAGWMHKSRDLGGMTFMDIRDRYGKTQVVFNMETDAELCEKARQLNREFVVQITGKVVERSNKNTAIPTGEIEIEAQELNILNAAKTPPFTIENDTDGGEELRMKYRYLDIRREKVRSNLIFRHEISLAVRKYLAEKGFIEVETPYLIKSTPEGARDFIVPSRMNQGMFYALPQSPQTFKQLLMVAGMDKYFQIVKCFRDEDLRADRQPEFTQIDCEMAFIEQEDILNVFEGLTKYLLKSVKGVDVDHFPRMTYAEAMEKYGNDKPDIRFGMEFGDLTSAAQHRNFKVFDTAEAVIGIAVPGGASYSRKEIDALIDWVKRPQIGALGMVYVKCNEDGSYKSSVDKFYNQEDLAKWAEITGAGQGDLICVLSGDKSKVQAQLSALRMEMGNRLGLRKPDEFAPLWVVDFPLLEWDEETNRYHAMHHPFTSPKPEDVDLLNTAPGKVRANAYDLVLNGNEIGGGSIRIHDKSMQAKMFDLLGFTPEEAKEQFGFLMDAFEYGAPPHGGLAFGFDRLVAILGGQESIRDFIAFPKNNAGRDVMIESPSVIDATQLDELGIDLKD